MYRGYQDGFLPYEGALTDQPNNLVHSLAEVSSIKAMLDKQDAEKDNPGNDTGNQFKSVLPE